TPKLPPKIVVVTLAVIVWLKPTVVLGGGTVPVEEAVVGLPSTQTRKLSAPGARWVSPLQVKPIVPSLRRVTEVPELSVKVLSARAEPAAAVASRQHEIRKRQRRCTCTRSIPFLSAGSPRG